MKHVVNKMNQADLDAYIQEQVLKISIADRTAIKMGAKPPPTIVISNMIFETMHKLTINTSELYLEFRSCQFMVTDDGK